MKYKIDIYYRAEIKTTCSWIKKKYYLQMGSDKYLPEEFIMCLLLSLLMYKLKTIHLKIN